MNDFEHKFHVLACCLDLKGSKIYNVISFGIFTNQWNHFSWRHWFGISGLLTFVITCWQHSSWIFHQLQLYYFLRIVWFFPAVKTMSEARLGNMEVSSTADVLMQNFKILDEFFKNVDLSQLNTTIAPATLLDDKFICQKVLMYTFELKSLKSV